MRQDDDLSAFGQGAPVNFVNRAGIIRAQQRLGRPRICSRLDPNRKKLTLLRRANAPNPALLQNKEPFQVCRANVSPRKRIQQRHSGAETGRDRDHGKDGLTPRPGFGPVDSRAGQHADRDSRSAQ